MKCMWKRGWATSHVAIVAVLWVARLSQIRCTSNSAGIWLSSLVRNFLNSVARCGSLLILNVSTRCGLSPKAFQIRP